MLKAALILLLHFCYLVIDAQPAQRFHSFTYGVNEGLLQPTIYSIAIDKNNYCWISFPNGIQKFDGKNFIRIPVQPGLPDDTKSQFFTGANGDLLISHLYGISKYEIETNSFRLVYENSKKEKGEPYFLEEDESIIYILNRNAEIVGLHSQTLKLIEATATSLPAIIKSPQNFPIVSNVLNGRIALAIQNTIYLWDLRGKSQIAKYSLPAAIEVFSVHLLNPNEVLFNSFSHAYGVMRLNIAGGTLKPYQPGIAVAQFTRIKIGRWKDQDLLAADNRLFRLDKTCQITSELLNSQNLPFTSSGEFTRIAEDKFGNLYLATVSNGIVKIVAENYPINYFGSSEKAQNNVLSILPDKKQGRVLAGTTKGLLIFDLSQKLIHQITRLSNNSDEVKFNAIVKDSDGSYLLSASGNVSGMYRLSKDLSLLQPLKMQGEQQIGPSYFGNPLFQNKDEVLIQSQAYLYKINPKLNVYREHRFSQGYVLSGLHYNKTIIAHAFDELLFLDAVNFKLLRRVPFPNTGDVRCYAAGKQGHIYMGSNNGIFIINETGKILQRHTTATGLPDNCIYAMAFDENGLLWCSSNKGLFRVNSDGSFFQLTKEDGLQENEFNTNAVAMAEDGEMYFGGVNGISSFYPSVINSHTEKLKVFLTAVKANNKEAAPNSAVWNLQSLKLPHNQNALSFDFVAMGSSNPDQYIYQYRMKELDEEWIQNDGLQTVRYSLLPGRYVFQLYASRVFDKAAKPMHELVIVIAPPFWQTWWFRIIAIAVVAGFVVFVVNRRNKGIYRKKLETLQAEHELQLQRERISRDLHDNIGAYANAVLYKTELLEKNENDLHRIELMSDLKFASKDIITSLRETVWALKKEAYTAQDCLLRIRNFMQTLSRYYPHMQFHVNNEAPVKKELHYTAALNVVRIAQEIITNAVKHSSATVVHLTNTNDHECWIMTFIDDGKGFDEGSLTATQKGEGLANLRKRAAESSFDIEISSEQGCGTTITLSVP